MTAYPQGPWRACAAPRVLDQSELKPIGKASDSPLQNRIVQTVPLAVGDGSVGEPTLESSDRGTVCRLLVVVCCGAVAAPIKRQRVRERNDKSRRKCNI